MNDHHGKTGKITPPRRRTVRTSPPKPSRRLALPRTTHDGGQAEWPYDVDPDLRYRMISEGAYHRYLDRGCIDGYDMDDWLAAEEEVDRQLTKAAEQGDRAPADAR